MNSRNDFLLFRYYMARQKGLLECDTLSRIDTDFIFCHHEVTHVHI